MSRTDDTVAQNREQTGTRNRDTLGMIRRVVITVTSGPFWQTVGLLLLDGVTKETDQVEVFPGIGFFSRPAPGANAEAIQVHAGGKSNPALVATRDEDTRRKVAKIDQDETMVFNTKAVMHITKAGQVHARAAGGAAVALATKADLDALASFISAHVHPAPGGTTSPPTGPVPAAAGTTVLKGQ